MELRLRGAGLVLAAKEVLAFIKASALGRVLSAAKLTARFGAYQAPMPEIQSLPAQARYAPARNHNLWADYQHERQQILADKKMALAAITDRRTREADAIKAEMAAKRAQVFKSVLLTPQQKRALYRALSAELARLAPGANGSGRLDCPTSVRTGDAQGREASQPPAKLAGDAAWKPSVSAWRSRQPWCLPSRPS